MEAPLENILMLTFHSCLNISTGLWIACKHRDLGHLSVRKALPQDLNSYTPKSKRDYGNWTQIQCSYPFPLTITHLLDYTAKKGQDSVVTIICKTLNTYPFETSISDDLSEDTASVKETAAPNAGGCYLHFIHQLHVEFNWLFLGSPWLGFGLRPQTTDCFDRNWLYK